SDFPCGVVIPYVHHHAVHTTTELLDAATELVVGIFADGFIKPVYRCSVHLKDSISTRCAVGTNRSCPPGTAQCRMGVFIDMSVNIVGVLMGMAGKHMNLLKAFEKGIQFIPIFDAIIDGDMHANDQYVIFGYVL